MKSHKSVLVIGMNGIGLMPTTACKARKLLEAKKAKVYSKMPFTIKLLYKTGCAVQNISLGIDTGSQHIGVAVTTDNCVQLKDEHELRSTMEKRKLIETRAEARRSRRYRKTRYRKPKFKPHCKHVYMNSMTKRHGHKTHWHNVKNEYGTNRQPGWVPPSIQQKIDHHIQIINRYLEALPKKTKVNIEVGRFDTQKVKNPDIKGTQYQLGRMYDYENKKAYILAKCDYKCPICGRKFGSVRENGSIVKFRKHHMHFVSNGATDNPDSYMAICDCCHTAEAHGDGGILNKIMKESKKTSRGLRDMPFMNILRRRLWNAFPEACFTYGNITNADRKWISLPKTHANDAVAIAMHEYLQQAKSYDVKDVPYTKIYKEVRKKKRSLHEMNPRKGRRIPNTSATRNSKNTKSVINKRRTFSLYDKVRYAGQIGWITGFSGTNTAYLKNKEGKYITIQGKNYKNIPLSNVQILERNNTWITYTK